MIVFQPIGTGHLLNVQEELKVEYEIKKYQRTAESRAPLELLKVHPLGKSPVITDGDDVVLAESGAIVEYIIQKYGNGKCTPTEPGYLDNLYFTHYAESSLMPIGMLKIVFDYIPKSSPFFLRPLLNAIFNQIDKRFVTPELTKHMDLVEKHLEKTNSSWFAGGAEPTSADFQMFYVLDTLIGFSGYPAGPKTKAYVGMVRSRPAYVRGLEKSGEAQT
ncbi:glutathione S-transferase [Coprinopsis cinerea okayama7|uniref:Glutathione S-transferase n=1 Tax=Coprinopsis cinerea (strain Okayama-7 / 130 / ATCC MYA-4618 / FGSC 9003) TaxID=240176 RepID=A8PCR4_COPC7|nr:glutathione S-transferase [Coprinopsis cinerea okayama7\|eukprot:XP_001840455.2 glutathione S-transferase [Coprinopsis cinerea okayama7\